MRLTPEDIEARRFRLAPNGYECEAVDRFLAEVIETLHEQPEGVIDSDEFSRAGQEIASILRSARDSAGAMRAEAEGLAASMRSRAELEAADLRQQASDERDQAKVILLDAQRQAEIIVREAEQQVAGAVAMATAQAEAHANQIVDQAEQQLEEIHRSERAAHQRLLGARTDLQQAIDRLSTSVGGTPEASLLDLTLAPPAEDVATIDDAPAAEPSIAADPLLRMVRAAVGRAAQHSTSRDLEDEAPAV